MSTMQDVVDLARIPLNDPAKVAYPDATLLKFANAAVRYAFQLRPDLRLGSFGTAYADLTLAGTFPLGDDYLQTLADYVSGRAEMGDDEHVNSNRAQQLLTLFASELR